MLHPAANRHPKATHQWLLMGIQVCRLPALLQPTGTPGPYINGFSPRPHINGFFWASKSAVCQPSCSQQAPQGHTSMASSGHPSLPFASPLAANRHPRATHQWLLMGVQVCRLPALKPLKPSKHSKRSKPLKPSKPFKTVRPLKRWLGMLHPAANRHPKATHQWLLMGIQVCRLPALLQPTGTPGPYINGFSPRPHINGFFWASKSAVCQPSCSQQAPQGHTSMASYGRPSLPFASPQTLKTLQTLQTLQTLKTLQTLQNRKTLKTLTWHASSCSQPPPQGHTSMASYGHPSLPFASPLAANRHPRAIHQWLLPKATHQWLLLGIQVCRLPALLQPTGTPGPHINGFLWASKSAVCQPSNP